MGIKVEDQFLHMLLFADNQVVTAADENDMNYMLRKLTEHYDQISFDKTKYLVTSGADKPVDINGNCIEIS